jgi:hypothetical protein
MDLIFITNIPKFSNFNQSFFRKPAKSEQTVFHENHSCVHPTKYMAINVESSRPLSLFFSPLMCGRMDFFFLSVVYMHTSPCRFSSSSAGDGPAAWARPVKGFIAILGLAIVQLWHERGGQPTRHRDIEKMLRSQVRRWPIDGATDRWWTGLGGKDQCKEMMKVTFKPPPL